MYNHFKVTFAWSFSLVSNFDTSKEFFNGTGPLPIFFVVFLHFTLSLFVG